MTNAQNINAAVEAIINYGVDHATDTDLSGPVALAEIIDSYQSNVDFYGDDQWNIADVSVDEWSAAFVQVLSQVRDYGTKMLATDETFAHEVRRCTELIKELTMTTAQTTAQQIADRFHNDGQVFTVDGVDIDEVAEETEAYSHSKGDCTLHVFDDGSMLVIGNFWDIITDLNGVLTDSNGEGWGSLEDWQ